MASNPQKTAMREAEQRGFVSVSKTSALSWARREMLERMRADGMLVFDGESSTHRYYKSGDK